MNLISEILKKINYKIYINLYRNKTFSSEEEFYTHLFTKNPSWSSTEGNEEELIRWKEIKVEIEKLEFRNHKLSILEIGCGRGWLCNKLLAYGKVVGIDPIKPVIKFAKKKFRNVTFFSETPSSFLYKNPESKFDLIISTEVIEHVKDKNSFVLDINKLLKMNGVVILTTPRLEHYQDFVKAFGDDPNQPIEEWISEAQLKSLFKNNGFSILSKRFFSPLVKNNETINITQLLVCKKNN